MKTLRRANERIRWPRASACAARNDPDASGPWCLCGSYDGADGWYVLDEERHAVAYCQSKRRARDHAAWLDSRRRKIRRKTLDPEPESARPGIRRKTLDEEE